METILKNQNFPQGNVQPLCPVFKECGGCHYQNISYSDELTIKENILKGLFRRSFGLDNHVFQKIIPSPKPYHYRNRLDLKLKRTRTNEIFIGFTPADKKGVIPIEACFIADENISNFIPELKRQAVAQLPLKYKNANLTVRTGQDGRVLWGGIGRRSCQLPEKDYFSMEIEGKRIFYSLDTFFQANSSILPRLFEVINHFSIWGPTTTFYDLYGGVGFFSIGLSDKANKVFMIEENCASLSIARYNIDFNKLDHIKIIEGKVENHLSDLLNANISDINVVLIDPPRVGLSEKARQLLIEARNLSYILYLSCNPDSLVRDLGEFVKQKWKIERVVPFDFFPKTRHIETLVLLKS